MEIYREYGLDGIAVSLERETFHVDGGQGEVARVETRTIGSDDGVPQQTRYQYANHLGSAVLELGDHAEIITYEEYFPYGGTSYQAVATQTDSAKRYRYTGKERDEENDLYYHGARYYAPWLGRWVSCDPIGLQGGPNWYEFAAGNPVKLVDIGGKQPTNSIDDLLTFIHAQAGFEAGPGFSASMYTSSAASARRAASAFGTAAHARATDVVADLKRLGFKEAERIHSEVRVEGGVVTQIGGTPGGPRGAHNIDLLVTKPGDTLAVGQDISGGYASVIGDLKYGGGKINPKYAVHGSPLQTVTGKTAAVQGTGGAAPMTAAEEAEMWTGVMPEVAKADEVVSAAKVAGEAGKLEKVVAASAKVAKATAKVAKVLKPLASVAKVAGKVAGPLSVAASAVELATAKTTEQRVDAGIGLVGNALMASDNPVAMAGGAGILIGQYAEKKLNVSEYASDHGIAAKEFLERHHVSSDNAFIAGAVVTVASTPIALGEAAAHKIASWF
jgi:RHS repeat-associated protein